MGFYYPLWAESDLETKFSTKVYSDSNFTPEHVRGMVDGIRGIASLLDIHETTCLFIPLRGAIPLGIIMSEALRIQNSTPQNTPMVCLPLGTSTLLVPPDVRQKYPQHKGIGGQDKDYLIRTTIGHYTDFDFTSPALVDEGQTGSTGSQAARKVITALDELGVRSRNSLQLSIALDRRHNKIGRNIVNSFTDLVSGKDPNIITNVFTMPLPTVDNVSALPIMYKTNLNDGKEMPVVQWNKTADITLRALTRLASYGENILTFREDRQDSRDGLNIKTHDPIAETWIKIVLNENLIGSQAIQFKRWLQKFIQ